MASVWDSILTEFNNAAQIPRAPGSRAFWADIVESRIKNVHTLSGVPLIIYASACTAPAGKAPPELLQIDPSDKIGFHSMLEDIDGPKLDILIHSPGGFAEAAESIIEEIRHKFGYVRFIIPSYAKSAATMMVMSGDEILMDEDAELGPIDPQMYTRNGVTPAQAIKQQFEKAAEEIFKDPRMGQVRFPILQLLGPGLLAQCDNASALSNNLVRDWLSKYMFRTLADGPAKADSIATYLSNHGAFKSHARRVKLEDLRTYDLAVKNLRDEPIFYRAVWELYCAIDILLGNTPIFKVFYNSANVAMVRQQQQQGGLQISLPMLPQMIPRQVVPGPVVPQPVVVQTQAPPPWLTRFKNWLRRLVERFPG